MYHRMLHSLKFSFFGRRKFQTHCLAIWKYHLAKYRKPQLNSFKLQTSEIDYHLCLISIFLHIVPLSPLMSGNVGSRQLLKTGQHPHTQWRLRDGNSNSSGWVKKHHLISSYQVVSSHIIIFYFYPFYPFYPCAFLSFFSSAFSTNIPKIEN